MAPKSSRISSTLSIGLILPLCFVIGTLLGKVNLDSIIRATMESYTNRYLTMSGSQRTQITYYVYSKQKDTIESEVMSTKGVLSIKQDGPENLYDVVIAYPQRREVVKALKELPGVLTVFTVPLLCH